MFIPDTNNDYDIFISEQEKIIFKQNEDPIPTLNLNVESASNEIIKDSIYNDSVNQNIIEQDNVTFKENVIIVICVRNKHVVIIWNKYYLQKICLEQ